MRTNRKSRFQRRLASTSFVVLLLTVVGLLLWLSRDYHAQFDWTRNQRNTLSEASRALLATLDKPVQLNAYARDTEGVRQNIAEFVARWCGASSAGSPARRSPPPGRRRTTARSCSPRSRAIRTCGR